MGEEPVVTPLAFWGALVSGDTAAAQDSAREVLGHTPHVSSSYAFHADEDEQEGEAEGKPPSGGQPVAPDTPGPTVELWNSEEAISFIVISLELYCLARTRSMNAQKDFQACDKPVKWESDVASTVLRHNDLTL